MRSALKAKIENLAADIADHANGYEVTIIIRHVENAKDVTTMQFLPTSEESMFPYWRAAVDAAHELMLHAASMRDDALAEIEVEASESDESDEDEGEAV